MQEPNINDKIKETLGCAIPIILVTSVVIYLWNLSSANDFNKSNEIQIRNEKKKAIELRMIQFAESYYAIIPDTNFSKNLTFEKQERLMPGKAVAINIKYFDIIFEKGIYKLTGYISGFNNFHADLIFADHMLQSAKSIKQSSKTLNVIAEINEFKSSALSIYGSDNGTFFTAIGRVIAIKSPLVPENDNP
jgi:hypothetical protein